MKHLLWSIVATMAVLVAAVTGCGRAPRYDARLVAIDSLMHDAPDSALALVQAIGTLPAPADRAYRDLLLTQARYRCYVTATSDSDINRALAYYRAHSGEREKLTRAFIYKGAVMDELGHPDSAMLYYKHAEATAAPDDYFNLGYAKMRIGALYQNQFSQDSSALNVLREAKHYFEILRDTNYIIVTLGKLGAINGIIRPDSTKLFFREAINLAQQYNPSLQYTYKSKLAGLYIHEENYKQAKQLAMDVMINGAEYCGENQFYFYACEAYLKLGFPDSAKHILGILPKLENPVDSMNYYNTMAELALWDGNNNEYGKYTELSKKITTRILLSKKESVLTQANREFDNLQHEKRSHKLKNSFGLFILITTLVILLFLGVLCRLKYKLHRFEIEKSNILREMETTMMELADLKEKQELNTHQEEPALNQISELVGYRISAINELYDAIRIKTNEASDKRKSVMPLSGLLKELNEKKQLLEINLSESFWDKMKMSVDGEYNGIVTFVQSQYPELTDNDIKLFCLLCANISPQIIRLCMNYTSDKTSSTYRNRIIQKKMGLDMTFDQFISRYMKGDFNDKN